MNIFDPLISGSLSVSGSGNISGDLTVLGTINATISGTTSNAISASHAASYTLTSSFEAFTSSYTTGSFTGSFIGNGSGLYNIPASGVTGLNLTRIADGSATASISNVDGLRVNTNTEITGALTISGSITLNGVPVGTGKLDEVVFNAYSSSNNTTNSLQNGRLDSLESTTSSLNTFTSSTTGRLNAIETTTGSLNTFTSSTNTILGVIETTTASLNTFTSSANGRLNAIETTTGSLNTFTSSANGRLNSIETSTSSLNSYTSSTDTRLGIIETTTGSLNSYTSSNTTNINAIHGTTSSLNTFTSSANERLTSIETSTSSLNTFTSSASDRLTSIESATSSIRTDFNSFTSSNNSVESTQNGRLTSLENVTGSYATTGSNIFQGSQTITGSLFISQNLIVGGSSSINFISQSTLNIGTNLITVNAQNPGTRFGGLAVIDSGSSPTVSGSMLFDSINDQWIFVHQAIAGSPTTSSVVLMGPESFNSLGSEIYPTTNRVVKSINSEHLGDSNISDNGTTVTILSNTVINGTLSATGTTLVSGSSQVIYSGLTGIPSGIISGSSQVLNGTTIHSGSFFNNISVVSGSGQISFNGITDKPSLVSGSSQISFNSISDRPTLVSGSSQIDLTATTNYSSGIKTRLNAEGVISGSAQISSAGFITGYTETDTLATVTGRGASTSTDLTFNGALTMGTTGTQYIRMGRFPSGTTNSGEAWIGRASDRSAGTMTIQLGTGTDRNFEVVDHAWSTVVFNAGMNSITYKNNVVWHAGNDGAASGLDADLLDGSHASAFSPVAGSSSITTVGTIATGVWNGTAIAVANGGTGASTAANAITNLGATTVGGNLFTLTNPSAIRFIRINDNNTISTLSDSDFRTAIGAGTSSTTGTVTSVGGTGTVSGLSLSGTVTSTGNLTLGGTLTVAASNFSSQTANTFLAAPNGSSGTPTFRTIVAADVPTLNQNTTGTASNITAYTINQNVGTGNSPSFAGVTSSGTVAASGGASGGFLSSTYASGFNRIWAFGNSTGYGLGYYQGGTDYIGFHFGSTSSPQYSFFQNGNMTLSGNITPTANGTQNLGSSSARWNTVFTSDLSMSNGIGDYTIVEGEEKLYLYNNKNNKVYSFVLQEEDPATATPKRPE
jgi:hypothetical protein